MAQNCRPKRRVYEKLMNVRTFMLLYWYDNHLTKLLTVLNYIWWFQNIERNYNFILCNFKISLTVVDFQLDAQNSYLFTYNTFIKILYMFRVLPCSSSGDLHRNCIYMHPLVSSLSAGDCPVHRLSSFLTGAQDSQSPADSDDITGCIYTITM